VCLLGGGFGGEAEGGGDGAEGGDAGSDVVFERDAEFLSASDEIVAADAACKGLVFHLALHGVRLDFEDGLAGLDQGTGGEKAGHFVTGEKGAIERGFARNAGVIGVGQDGMEHLLGIAAVAQDFCSGRGMAFAGVVLLIGPALVIEIVQQGGQTPKLLIGRGFAGVSAHASLDGQSVFAQIFVLGELAEEIPGVVAGGHQGRSKCESSFRGKEYMGCREEQRGRGISGASPPALFRREFTPLHFLGHEKDQSEIILFEAAE